MFDNKSLKAWFLREKRELPWREDPIPYAVWISEVMLQQTQVSVVIPYFERWMQAFPTIQALAAASLDDVIKLWEGLGYYSRARNLHAGARYIMDHFEGQLPADAKLLGKIKGIGDYTAGAILSFAFHQRHPAVDGNVIRVLCRYFRIEEDISKAKTQRQLKELAKQILPDQEPWIAVEALIELGATVCRRKPNCPVCPLKVTCKSRLEGRAESLPFKTSKGIAKKLLRAVAVIECKGYFLVRKVEEGSIMSGLHEFPYFEIKQETIEPQELIRLVKDHFQIHTALHQCLPDAAHSFTQFHARLFPFHLLCEKMPPIEGFKWMNRQELKKVAFPSGHRTIFASLQ